ncbi:PIF1 [Sanghuangporus vaninii]
MPSATMSSSSSTLQSGLKTMKRNWSNNDPASTVPSSETRTQASSRLISRSSSSAPLSDAEKKARRLAAIQAGLDEVGFKSQPLKDSSIANTKRLSDGHESESASKKKRILPDSFLYGETSSKPPSRGSRTTTPSMTVMNERRQDRSERKAAEKPAKIFLSKEQMRILELVDKGHSVFYTGSAGTGKSVLLREIIKTLRKKYVTVPDAVAITASTGIAACNIGGVTIHSFAGIGLGIESAEELVKKIRKNKKAMARWLRTKVLIVDEVSMVDGDLFDKLSRIGGMIRKRSKPFGEIQIIVTGDFFQLPPVMKGNDSKFAFEAQTWNETIGEHTYNLTKVFRQKDEDFVDMLNEMRFGRLTSRSISKFKSLSREIHYEDGMAATELFPRREDVDRSNSGRMTRLTTEEHKYVAVDGGTITDLKQREKMLANFMAPSVLTLKVDAQVMLIKNVDETLVNGSIGRVIRFMDPSQARDEGVSGLGEEKGGEKQPKKPKSGQLWPVVEFRIPGGFFKEVMIVPESFKVELPNGEVQASRTQLPLILSWAMSIHKSQGQTLERVKVDLGKVFEKGQAYVALSRATSLDGLQVLNFDVRKVMAHPKVIEWSKSLQTIPN